MLISPNQINNVDSHFSLIIVGVVCFCARVMTSYLGYEPEVFAFVLLAILLYLCACVYLPQFCIFDLSRFRIRFKGWDRGLLVLFSLLLAVTIIVSNHIHINSSSGITYAGTIAQNYIEPFSLFDMLGFLVVSFSLLALSSVLTSFVISHCCKKENRLMARFQEMDRAKFVALFVLFVVAWFPYLLVYWPGFIFGDSTSSLSQALGLAPLSNHHPVLLAMFLRACIHLVSLFGLGTTVGVGLYSLIQLVLMSVCFAYACAWIPSRTGLPYIAAFALAFILALSPYVASYSVAVWKDPIFSCAVLLLFLFVLDFNLGNVKQLSYFRCFLLAAIQLMAMFMRNNGVCIIVIVALIFASSFLLRARANRFVCARALGTSLACIVVYAAISGSVYSYIGVQPTEKVESLGIPLNQMARVAALDGDMSDSDAAYMDAMLPLSQYKDKYRPCCTDLLKWDSEFNSGAIDSAFMKHWFSMLLRNPIVYVDAWILQTFGYWTINQTDVVNTSWNIDGGAPQNWDNSLALFDVYPANLLGNDSFQQIFTYFGTSVPCGVVLWMLLLMSIIFFVANKGSYSIAFFPIFALIGTLLIASPIWYWPRYIFAAQLSLPFCIIYTYVVLCRDFRVSIPPTYKNRNNSSAMLKIHGDGPTRAPKRVVPRNVQL